MEKLIKDALFTFLHEEKLLTNEQHGFRSNRSTVTQMLSCLDNWTSLFDHGTKSQIDAIYIDFAKAFDSISHPKLIQKLNFYGIQGNLLRWISAFLSGRTQVVKINDTYSKSLNVTSGVPQGTVLGPILFIIFVNDIVKEIKFCDVKIFADDIKLSHVIRNAQDVINFQSDLNRISAYAKRWQLTVSYEKCSQISYGKLTTKHIYTLDGHRLVTVSKIKDLGFYLENNLRPSYHCQKIANTAKILCCHIRRSFISNDHDFLSTLFKTYVRPILEYGSPVWNPWLLKDIEKLESVQRAYTKRYPGLWNLSYHARLQELNLESLEVRRLKADIYEAFKILNNQSPLSSENILTSSRHSTRQELIKVGGKCAERLHFFSNRVVPFYNSVPPEIRHSASLVLFKSRLQKIDSDAALSIFGRFLKGHAIQEI